MRYTIKKCRHTNPGDIFSGQNAIAGSLTPPSYVVSFPQRNGPLLPPWTKCFYE